MAYRKMVDKFVCSLQKKCIAISPEKTRKREQREKEATLRVYKVIFSPKNVGYRQKERRTQNGRKWLPKQTCVCVLKNELFQKMEENDKKINQNLLEKSDHLF